MKPLSILLVDDDDDARGVIVMALDRAGHRVMHTGNPKLALDFMRAADFDVVLTDVIMPDMDGMEIIAAAKRLQPRARLIAMSGGTGYLAADFCLKLARAMGGGITLRKPFSVEELIAAVGQAESGQDTGTADPNP